MMSILNRSESMIPWNEGITSMSIKNLTHSALKNLCNACNLNTTSDIIGQKDYKIEIQRLKMENEKLYVDLEEKKEKNLILSASLEAKQKEYDIMFKHGTDLCDRFNSLHKENVKLIESLKQELAQSKK